MSAMTNKRFKPTQTFYGQLVLGPPGAGKTTYCMKMSDMLKTLGRQVIIVNLDPANDTMNYKPDIDIRELIVLEEVMEQIDLGPNGALLYCMEYLESNIDWLLNQLHGDNGTTFLFDLPGQVELYCHHKSLSNIVSKLTNVSNMLLCVVHLIDSHHCSDAGKFIAALMLSLSAMLNIGLPHINLLTKSDLLKKHYEKLNFSLDFYTEVLDLNYLLDCLNCDNFTNKYKKLNSAFISIIEDYSLVTFQLVNMMNEKSLASVKNLVDKANGYVFKTEEGRHINSMLACAMGVGEPANFTVDLE
ncbi:GPN-loop GTPase 2 [Bombyx mandarina]|uniref:GPN-loop GTPase 2 n=1 Tax=Bombyx mandarina TaxID=7092 RepID=A0A6J2KIC9_BOMMA|nr:GPN-loop GTPase 2 [Bombyx mandarina]XP_028040706.1 GPN-loop GTPase 2 [Bombyx mandarina]XP_028040707.1 GPN-loop GTPase 2 [Bombyx mandarina]